MSSPSSSSSLAPRVRSVYRQIMRTARAWPDGKEQAYIRHEASTLFRKNSGLKDLEEIKQKIFEAETRHELGVFYKIPYPRPTHLAPGSTGEKRSMVTPQYMHSYKPKDEAHVPKHIGIRKPRMQHGSN